MKILKSGFYFTNLMAGQIIESKIVYGTFKVISVGYNSAFIQDTKYKNTFEIFSLKDYKLI